MATTWIVETQDENGDQAVWGPYSERQAERAAARILADEDNGIEFATAMPLVRWDQGTAPGDRGDTNILMLLVLMAAVVTPWAWLMWYAAR